MSKSIYIPKGQECRMANITCDNLVVNGSLEVEGKIHVMHIRGNGSIIAGTVSAKTITFNTLEANVICAGRLTAHYVEAEEIHAIREMSVTIYADAHYVKTKKILTADSDIDHLYAEKNLPLKRRSQTLHRIVSSVQVMRIARFCRLSQKYMIIETSADTKAVESVETSDAVDNSEDDESCGVPFDGIPAELADAVVLANDPEFLRLKAMYRLTRETGDIWQLVPKTEPTDRAVTLSDRFALDSVA